MDTLLTDTELVAAYGLDQQRRGLSERYISDCRYTLRRFGEWLEPKSLIAADRDDVELWLDRAPIGLDARRNYLGFLDGFYRFAADRFGSTNVPTARIRRPRQHRRPPRPIHDESLRRALTGTSDPRVRAWMVLAAFAGLRCLEIAGLDVDDVDDGARMLQVRRGKGGKGRVVPLHPEVMAALAALPIPKRGPIFPDEKGRRVAPYVVSQGINRQLRRLSISSTAHSLRHWFATRLYRQTTDLRLVQDVLGHSSPATTAIYAAWDLSKAAPAVQALSI